MTASVRNIPTRYALVRRAQKILKEIDDYFQDADAFGLSAEEADPGQVLLKIRRSLVETLEREGRIRGDVVAKEG